MLTKLLSDNLEASDALQFGQLVAVIGYQRTLLLVHDIKCPLDRTFKVFILGRVQPYRTALWAVVVHSVNVLFC